MGSYKSLKIFQFYCLDSKNRTLEFFNHGARDTFEGIGDYGLIGVRIDGVLAKRGK